MLRQLPAFPSGLKNHKLTYLGLSEGRQSREGKGGGQWPPLFPTCVWHRAKRSRSSLVLRLVDKNRIQGQENRKLIFDISCAE